jgi:hypothetical protein
MVTAWSCIVLRTRKKADVKIFRQPKAKTRAVIDKSSVAAPDKNQPLSDDEALKEARRVYEKYRATMRKLAQ